MVVHTGNGDGSEPFDFAGCLTRRAQSPSPQVIKYLILHILLSFQVAYFLANLRGLSVSCPIFGCGRYENLSGAISRLTFSRAEPLTSGEAEVIGGGNSQNRRFVLRGKPRSFRCSAQPAGSRGVRRINVRAVSWVTGARATRQTEAFRPPARLDAPLAPSSLRTQRRPCRSDHASSKSD
jgi:hypothetical protein